MDNDNTSSSKLSEASQYLLAFSGNTIKVRVLGSDASEKAGNPGTCTCTHFTWRSPASLIARYPYIYPELQDFHYACSVSPTLLART